MQVFAATQAILQGAKQFKQQHHAEHNNNQMLVVPGWTITNLSNLSGTKVFKDASWKQPQEQGGYLAAGLGIVIQLGEDSRCTRLLISAMSPPVSSALQAETYSMLLASTIVQHLQLEQVNFFTDCEVLAKAGANHSIIDSPGHWEIRPQLAKLFITSSFDSQKNYHVHRSINFKAHFQARLAHKLQNRSFLFSMFIFYTGK
jgi:hypothetical protein